MKNSVEQNLIRVNIAHYYFGGIGDILVPNCDGEVSNIATYFSSELYNLNF